MIWNKLPHCDKLFEKFLSPWYPEDERPKMTRPDMYVISGYEDKTLDIDRIQYLTEEGLKDTKDIFEKMRESYQRDFQNFKEFKELNLDVIDSVDKAFGKKEVKELIKISDPKDFENGYLVTVCEFGLALGDLFVQTGKFKWLYSYPYFHSIVINPETGQGITVFDWAVKKFSSYGIDDGYKWKFLKVMEIIEDDIKTLGNKVYN
ncbi:hypothetical protein [Tenacibaculum sp. MEBiC07804]|uniref:hypothetical protein n=2 Tax=unclassified Tenacibaculum TaxID=2635139 RepID=UPI003BAD7F9D